MPSTHSVDISRPRADTAAGRATAIGGVAIGFWAALAVLTVGAHGVPPFELLALTFAIACAAGLVVLGLRGQLRQVAQPPAPWLTAFAGLFAYHALYFYALGSVPPAQASLIAYLWPLLIVLFAAVLAGERLRPRHLAGALLGLSGTGLLLAGRGSLGTGLGSPLGYAAAAGCAVVWSGYSVLNRRFAATPSGMLVGVCGAVALAGALCHLAFETTVRPGAGQWPSVILLGLGPTGLAFLAWDHATKHGRLALLGALSYLAPLLSTLLLVVTGQVALTWPLLVASLLIVGGAVVATDLSRH